MHSTSIRYHEAMWIDANRKLKETKHTISHSWSHTTQTGVTLSPLKARSRSYSTRHVTSSTHWGKVTVIRHRQAWPCRPWRQGHGVSSWRRSWASFDCSASHRRSSTRHCSRHSTRSCRGTCNVKWRHSTRSCRGTCNVKWRHSTRSCRDTCNVNWRHSTRSCRGIYNVKWSDVIALDRVVIPATSSDVIALDRVVVHATLREATS